jgi:ATP-binding cassette subfamily B protein/subfamily B ATP-binding cassette protein MsbA
MAKFKQTWSSWQTLPRMFPYLRKYRPLVGASLLFSAVSVLLGLAHPWPLAFMVDCVLGNRPPPAFITNFLGTSDRYALLVFAAAASLAVAVVTNVVSALNEYVNTRLEQRLVLDFRSDLFSHAQRLSVNYHDLKPRGQLMTQILSEADASGTMIMAILPLVESVAMLIGMFAISYRLDPELALLSLVVVPFIYYSVGFYSRRIVPRLQEVRTLEWSTASILFESMSMIRVVAAFTREPHEYGRFRKQGALTADARVGITMRQTVFSLGVNTCTAAGTALLLGVGAYHVLEGKLTVGDLLVVLSYIASVYAPLEMISSTVGGLQTQLIAVQGAFMLLDEQPEIVDAPTATAIAGCRGAIAFDNVAFNYPGRNETVKDITFSVDPGTRVALVGPTGAGKTTLISLMMRFYEPKAGCIRVDGLDVREIALPSLREQFAVVLQTPQLFSGTIGDNIRYGQLDAKPDAIAKAAAAANAAEFIERLPEGYDTILGEGGAQLSVGERQRICIARAFLRDAPVLILDEPTSAIDSRTESVILDALDELMLGRTTFMIAHRLSTVRQADVIFVVNHGEIVERGTHEELLENDGLYRELYDVQSLSRRARLRVAAVRPAAEPLRLATQLVARATQRLRDEGDAGPLRALAQLSMHPLEDLRLAASMAQSLLHELEGQAGRDSFEREQLDEVARRLAAQLRLVSAENPA